MTATIDLTRVPAFYHNYINQVTETDLTEAFRLHQVQLLATLMDVPEEKWDYRYAAGKWSIREMVQHIIDAERIFGYRALRFARKDSTPLPGFEENLYVDHSEADRRSKNDLIDELTILQKSTAQLFASFSSEQLAQTGLANGNSVYVEAIGFITIGHSLHHRNILLERYLS